MKKHKGFSLIELIIVIALIGIVTAGSITLFSMIDKSNKQKCASSIQSALDSLRVETMAKNTPCYLYLYCKEGSYYLLQTDQESISCDGTGKMIGNGSIFINVDGTLLSDGNSPVKLAVNRKDGSYLEDNAKHIQFYQTISVNDKYVVHLVKSTGTHYVD